MEVETIIFIHEYLAEFYKYKEDPIEPPGVKNENLIASAAGRPFQSAGGQDAYPDTYLKAAALFHGICGNHAFHNGNKRTALLSTLYYLYDNGIALDKCTDDEMFDFTKRIAAHEICEDRDNEVETISSWLKENSRKHQKGEKPMKLIALREALGRFGFSIVDGANNRLDIYQGNDYCTQILKKGTHGIEDYDPPYISNLRSLLKLTIDDGIDSARFYGHKGITDDLNAYMDHRIEVMNRLAEM